MQRQLLIELFRIVSADYQLANLFSFFSNQISRSLFFRNSLEEKPEDCNTKKEVLKNDVSLQRKAFYTAVDHILQEISVIPSNATTLSPMKTAKRKEMIHHS